MALENRTIVCDYCGSKNNIPCTYYDVKAVGVAKDMCQTCFDNMSAKVVGNFSKKVLQPDYCEYTGTTRKDVINCIIDQVFMAQEGATVEPMLLEFKIGKEFL